MSCTKIQTLPHLRLPIISVWGERKEGRKGWNQQDNRRMTKKNFCPEERAALSGRAWPRPRIFIAGIYHGILRNIQHHISLPLFFVGRGNCPLHRLSASVRSINSVVPRRPQEISFAQSLSPLSYATEEEEDQKSEKWRYPASILRLDSTFFRNFFRLV